MATERQEHPLYYPNNSLTSQVKCPHYSIRRETHVSLLHELFSLSLFAWDHIISVQTVNVCRRPIGTDVAACVISSLADVSFSRQPAQRKNISAL